MITVNTTSQSQTPPVKAVGLISGGLDSTLAAKIIKDLGFDVYGVYFSMPWGCCDKTHAIEAANHIGIKFIVLQLDERYLKIVEKPKFGYGRAMNPCVDCRVHMFSRAAQYMKHIGAEFVFTGEVLGQRNMSQLRKSMGLVEEYSGLKGRLLRPLSAQQLAETDVEKQGIVQRDKLLSMTGRSRKAQYALAKELNITQFSAPAGGCLLTDQNFAKRMQDTLKHGYRNFHETIALKWGRHLRIDQNHKAILGRDENENINLIRYAHREDYIMQLTNERGPTLILKGSQPTEELLSMCAGIIQKFSRYKKDPSVEVKYWRNDDRNQIFNTHSNKISDEHFESMLLA